MLFEIFGYHLGSSSWITYTDGSPVQYLSYLPFGETSINHRRTDSHGVILNSDFPDIEIRPK